VTYDLHTMNKWVLAALCGLGTAISVAWRSSDELGIRVVASVLAFVVTTLVAAGILTLLQRRKTTPT
jgi:heme A synthase